MRQLLWMIALISIASGAARAEPSAGNAGEVEVLVAARDIAAGEMVTQDDLRTLKVPAKWITSSVIKPHDASYIVNQRLQLPVLKGGMLMWIQFESSTNKEILDDCVKALKLPTTASGQVARARQAALRSGATAHRAR